MFGKPFCGYGIAFAGYLSKKLTSLLLFCFQNLHLEPEQKLHNIISFVETYLNLAFDVYLKLIEVQPEYTSMKKKSCDL